MFNRERELLQMECLRAGLKPELIIDLMEIERSFEKRLRRRGLPQQLREAIEDAAIGGGDDTEGNRAI